MRSSIKRLVAVLLGLVIAALVVVTAMMFASIPSPSPPAHFVPMARIWSSRPAPGKACPGALDELLVTSDGGRDVRDPVGLRDVGRDRKCVVAAYPSGWAVTRIVTFVIKGEHVYVQAGGDTDCGRYTVAVQEQTSEVHLHEGKLCFDLDVEWLNGTPTREHWAGQLSFE